MSDPFSNDNQIRRPTNTREWLHILIAASSVADANKTRAQAYQFAAEFGHMEKGKFLALIGYTFEVDLAVWPRSVDMVAYGFAAFAEEAYGKLYRIGGIQPIGYPIGYLRTLVSLGLDALERGCSYADMRSIVRHRSDGLGCAPDDVNRLCRWIWFNHRGDKLIDKDWIAVNPNRRYRIRRSKPEDHSGFLEEGGSQLGLVAATIITVDEMRTGWSSEHIMMQAPIVDSDEGAVQAMKDWETLLTRRPDSEVSQ